MKIASRNLSGPPWPSFAAVSCYTQDELRREARWVAKGRKGRLLDWRLVIGRDTGVTLQVRVMLADGVVDICNCAI